MLLNVFGADNVLKVWNKLGSMYQSKSLGNKLFVQNKLYDFKIDNNDTMTKLLLVS